MSSQPSHHLALSCSTVFTLSYSIPHLHARIWGEELIDQGHQVSGDRLAAQRELLALLLRIAIALITRALGVVYGLAAIVAREAPTDVEHPQLTSTLRSQVKHLHKSVCNEHVMISSDARAVWYCEVRQQAHLSGQAHRLLIRLGGVAPTTAMKAAHNRTDT